MADLNIRLQGCMAALNHDHPLTCPFISGPADSKAEWITGYRYAIELPEIDRVRLRLAIMEQDKRPKAYEI